MLKKRFNITKVGQVQLCSNHPVLDDVAYLISCGANQTSKSFNQKEISVFVGAHRFINGRILQAFCQSHSLKIGLQTEHIFDSTGKPMWRKFRRHKILQMFLAFSYVVDLNPNNKPAYDFLPKWLRKRVIFGPYIFPSSPPPFVESSSNKWIFIGALTDYRKDIIERVKKNLDVDLITSNMFGTELAHLLNKYEGILNIHAVSGEYTEYPRLLRAILSGKPVRSEQLDSCLILHRHYLPIYPSSGERPLSDVQNKMSSFLCDEFSFEFLINKFS